MDVTSVRRSNDATTTMNGNSIQPPYIAFAQSRALFLKLGTDVAQVIAAQKNAMVLKGSKLDARDALDTDPYRTASLRTDQGIKAQNGHVKDEDLHA